MVFPSWAFYGLGTALLSATAMLLQEKFKVNSAALAFWNKIVCVTSMIPFVLLYGFPHETRFYVLLAVSAVLYAISDIVYFGGISKEGAGTVSRVLPASVIFSFLLWFAVDPSSLHAYLQKPVIAAFIFLVLCLWGYFATHMRKCAVSMQAMRTVWFVIFASIVGPSIIKESLDSTDVIHGIYGYPFIQGLMMISLWAAYFHVKKPITSSVLFSRKIWPYSILIGGVNAIAMVVGALGFYRVDNPAYVNALGYLNSFLILLVYAAIGRKNDGNVSAGIGMVVCTAVLIILKAQV